MDGQRKAFRMGIALILMAMVLRLGSAGYFRPLGQLLSREGVHRLLFFLETGRSLPKQQEVAAFFGESPPPMQESLPAFTPEDLELVSLKNTSGLTPDTEALLTGALHWELTGDEPSVLILHTHTTESYTKAGERYTETSAFRTLDEGYNMLAVGDQVEERLTRAGITVLHDRTLNDYPSYNGSYTRARATISQYLAKYPSIRLVLDLHRDAAGDDRNQMRTQAWVEGASCAQLMLVMGTDASGQAHPRWQENLALALKLQVQLERLAPGITRPTQLRPTRFNQDLCPGALLIEVGAAGNTHPEALLAAQILADAIIDLAKGSK